MPKLKNSNATFLVKQCYQIGHFKSNLDRQKLITKSQKRSILAIFGKPVICYQTVLQDRSLLIRQKLVENAKFKNSNATILNDFQEI